MAKAEEGIFQGMTGGIRRYINETIGELRKVSWPTRREATNLTGIVLVVMIGMSLFLGLLDLLFTRFFALILH